MAEPLSVSPHVLPARSLPPEPRWKVARKLKEISFQQTALWQIEVLSCPCRGSEPCSFRFFLQLKTPNALNHKLENRWGLQGFLHSLIKRRWLPEQQSEEHSGERGPRFLVCSVCSGGKQLPRALFYPVLVVHGVWGPREELDYGKTVKPLLFLRFFLGLER